MKVCKLCLQTFFMPLPYPLTFYGSKVFRFSSPIFRLPEPTPGFTGSLHPSFVNQAKVRKDSFLQKRKYTDEIFHFQKRPIHPGTGKQRITLTERKISQRRNSITQRRHFINQRRKSFRQLRKDYFTTNCLHDKTDFLYSILRIQSKNIISYSLPSPIPDGFFLLTSSTCRTEYPIHGLPPHPLLRKPRCIKTKKTPNKKMSGVFYQVFTDLQFKLLQQLLRKEFLQKLPCEV